MAHRTSSNYLTLHELTMRGPMNPIVAEVDQNGRRVPGVDRIPRKLGNPVVVIDVQISPVFGTP